MASLHTCRRHVDYRLALAVEPRRRETEEQENGEPSIAELQGDTHPPTLYVGGASSCAIAILTLLNRQLRKRSTIGRLRLPQETMAKSGSSAVSSELPGNQYVRLDFQSWNVTYALRSHAPEKNRHARELSAADSKEEVFCSTRLQRIVREVTM